MRSGEDARMKLGFCGLGLMGAAMARRLLAAGHDVKVWNRSSAKLAPLLDLGAHAADTPAAAARDVDGVLMCLFDADAVEAVVFGGEGIAQAQGLDWLVDHSSIPPAITRALAQRLAQANGVDWIDAPVSGGVGGAQTGTLTIMAGGAATHLAQASLAMRAYAGQITHMGPSGAGQAAKLCNQTIVAATIAAVAEAVGLAQRNGIDVERLPAALAGGWADSKPLQVFVPRMLQVQPHSIGAVSTMLKDIDTVMDVAQACGAPMPITAGVQQGLRSVAAMGLGEAELSAIVCLVWPERRADFLAQAGA